MMKNRLLGSIVLVVLFLSLAAPAQAGYVTIVNSSKMHCYVWFRGYFVNNATDMSTPCARPGGKEWTHTSLSVGYLVVRCGKQNCNDNWEGHQWYNVPGTWLPHRNFKATCVDERDWNRNTYKCTFTEEAP